MIIKNDKGEDIEVFTQEEMQARATEAAKEAAEKALEEFKASNPDKSGELEETKGKLAEAEALLAEAEKNGNKGQIDRLRKERDDAKKTAEEAKKAFDASLSAFRNEIVGDYKNELLDSLSNGDAELKKKIELEFNNYMPNAVTRADIKARLEKAYQLATGNKPAPSMLDGRTGGGDRGEGGGYRPPEAAKEISPNQRAIGAVLGITDQDRANFDKFKAEREGKKSAGLIPPNSF